jgi:DNA-binding response OmpR family regulator
MSKIVDRVKQILVVGNCQENLLLMQSILESQAYQIQLACSLTNEIVQIEKAKPDLIILNEEILTQSLDINYVEIINYLQTKPNFANLPILWLITESKMHLLQTFPVKREEIIYKPFDIDELLSKVDLLLQRNQAHQTDSCKRKKTWLMQVEKQDPLYQQQTELLCYSPETIWDKLLAEGYEIVNHINSFSAFN